MRWPEIEGVAPGLRLPPEVAARQLARADVPRVIRAIAAWYPSLAQAEDGSLLTAAFYEEEVAFAGEEDERGVLVLLLEAGTPPEPVGYLALEYEASDRSLLGRLSIVDPRWRGRGLGRALVQATVLVGRGLGAALVYGFAELDNRAQCSVLEKEGHVLCGILPDADRRPIALGPSLALETRYVPEALYVHALVPPEEWVRPREEAMRPGPAALLRVLFEDGAAVELPEQVSLPPVRLDPDVAASLRPDRGGCWPEVGLLAPQLGLPPDVTLEALAGGDVPYVVSQLPLWHPEIAHGSQAHLLDPSFYERSVALAGADPHIEARPVFAWVPRHRGEIVGVGFLSCDLVRSTLRGELGVIDPRRRGLGLSTVLVPLYVLIGQAIGVETIVAWATLRHPYAQRALEHGGFRLIGIVPASDRHEVAPGVVKYTYEAVYAMSLVPPERTYCAPPEAMLPGVARLARFVLGEPAKEAR